MTSRNPVYICMLFESHGKKVLSGRLVTADEKAKTM